MNKGRSVVPSAKEGLKKVGYNINQHTQLKTAIFLLVSE
jgi:hypothetical protein